MFRTIVADPPWSFSDKLPGKSRGAENNYSTLPFHRVVSFLRDTEYESSTVRLEDCIDDDALLFLWRVSAMQQEALGVMRAWGFEPKAEIVWVKTTAMPQPLESGMLALPKLHFGMGHYTRQAHETCLIGRRGRAKVTSRSTRSVFFAPYVEHSAKPDAFFKIVEDMTEEPRLELFARKRRPGWSQHGDMLE
jgi:N6-adenosine-specific RNA methylase IME4